MGSRTGPKCPECAGTLVRFEEGWSCKRRGCGKTFSVEYVRDDFEKRCPFCGSTIAGRPGGSRLTLETCDECAPAWLETIRTLGAEARAKQKKPLGVVS